MDQPAGDHRAGGHLHHLVVDVALHACIRCQFDALAGVQVAAQLAVHDHVRRAHLALDQAALADGEQPLHGLRTGEPPVGQPRGTAVAGLERVLVEVGAHRVVEQAEGERVAGAGGDVEVRRSARLRGAGEDRDDHLPLVLGALGDLEGGVGHGAGGDPHHHAVLAHKAACHLHGFVVSHLHGRFVVEDPASCRALHFEVPAEWTAPGFDDRVGPREVLTGIFPIEILRSGSLIWI